MLVLQVFAQKKEEEDDEQRKFGVKLKKKPQVELPKPPLSALQVDRASGDISRVFQKAGVSDFLTTLTPGAQKALYAASFAWGYENAAKYVKAAMNAEQVKNATEPEEKGRAAIESVQSQAQSEQPETFKETSKFVWSFYNEDLKESQAQLAKTEHISGGARAPSQQIIEPGTAEQAVALSISSGSGNPALIYCASAVKDTEEAQERQDAEQKRHELARLVVDRVEQEKVASVRRGLEKKSKAEIGAQASSLTLERRQEVLAEYEKAEAKLQEAIKVLDSVQSDDREEMKKVASSLPRELAKMVLRKDTLLSRRRAMRAQLVKWLAFASGSKGSLAAMSPSKLFKIASLESLLRGRK